jgi:hypothetical protein
MENNNDDVEVVPAKNDDVEVVPAKKKVVKWQKSKGSQDDSKPGFGSRATNTDEGTRRYEPSSSVLGKFMSFVFSPLGVAMIIFVSFNYPWLKQRCVVGVSSLSSGVLPTPIDTAIPRNPTTTTGIPKSVPVLPQPREVNKMAQKASSPSSSIPPELASPQSSLSSACTQTNPLMKVLDRNCRDEMRAVRREKRLEALQQQRELRERRSRSKAAAAAQQKQTYANAGTTRVNNKKKDAKDASLFDGDLECNNIISRQCRQKKRLLAQQQQLNEAEKK